MRMLVIKVFKVILMVEDKLIFLIKEGYVVYFGVKDIDIEVLVDKCVIKLLNLCIYYDENDKLNLKFDKDI